MLSVQDGTAVLLIMVFCSGCDLIAVLIALSNERLASLIYIVFYCVRHSSGCRGIAPRSLARAICAFRNKAPNSLDQRAALLLVKQKVNSLSISSAMGSSRVEVNGRKAMLENGNPCLSMACRRLPCS